jgi:hypothetical protein
MNPLRDAISSPSDVNLYINREIWEGVRTYKIGNNTTNFSLIYIILNQHSQFINVSVNCRVHLFVKYNKKY